jgi:hypothetical protein
MYFSGFSMSCTLWIHGTNAKFFPLVNSKEGQIEFWFASSCECRLRRLKTLLIDNPFIILYEPNFIY